MFGCMLAARAVSRKQCQAHAAGALKLGRALPRQAEVRLEVAAEDLDDRVHLALLRFAASCVEAICAVCNPLWPKRSHRCCVQTPCHSLRRLSWALTDCLWYLGLAVGLAEPPELLQPGISCACLLPVSAADIGACEANSCVGCRARWLQLQGCRHLRLLEHRRGRVAGKSPASVAARQLQRRSHAMVAA